MPATRSWAWTWLEIIASWSFLGDSIYQVHLELGSINFFSFSSYWPSFVTNFYVLGVVNFYPETTLVGVFLV